MLRAFVTGIAAAFAGIKLKKMYDDGSLGKLATDARAKGETLSKKLSEAGDRIAEQTAPVREAVSEQIAKRTAAKSGSANSGNTASKPPRANPWPADAKAIPRTN